MTTLWRILQTRVTNLAPPPQAAGAMPLACTAATGSQRPAASAEFPAAGLGGKLLWKAAGEGE